MRIYKNTTGGIFITKEDKLTFGCWLHFTQFNARHQYTKNSKIVKEILEELEL